MDFRMRAAHAQRSTAERLVFENIVAWRIIAMAGVGIAASHVLTQGYLHAGLSAAATSVAVFLTLNTALLLAWVECWRRSIFPLAPAGWRRGRRARIAILLIAAFASLLAFAPLNMQLMAAMCLAWYKLNV